MRKKGIYEKFIKRPQDIILSIILFILLSPIFIIVAFLVRLKLGSPILFTQNRPGLNEKIFKMYKFRTMLNETDENGELLPDSLRLNGFGKKLRSTSLDELPELWNIFKGDMSFVGPRPLLVEYLDLYNPFQKRRHETRPGLSGYAQINGRNSITWEEKFILDVNYVDNISFVGDWKILLNTIVKILLKSNINSNTSVTMEPFRGTTMESKSFDYTVEKRHTNTNDKLIIIGASGHGKVIADIAIKMNIWRTILFLDDNESLTTAMGIKVIGKTDAAFIYKDNADFFVAIGNNETRKQFQKKLENDGLNLAILIHPSSVIGTDVTIGAGTSVMAGAVINNSSKIGKGCIVNTNSSIDHDNIIGDFVHISPGVTLSGSVTIDKESWIGIGSVISNNINICRGCIVGAGAVVVKDIVEPGIYVGVPARRYL